MSADDKSTKKSIKKKDKKKKDVHTKDDLVVNAADFVAISDDKFRDTYTVGPQLGKGAFGEVRRCVHKVS